MRWFGGLDNEAKLIVPIMVEFPAEAAAAGIGMPSQRFNLDLHSDQPPMAERYGLHRRQDLSPEFEHAEAEEDRVGRVEQDGDIFEERFDGGGPDGGRGPPDGCPGFG